MRLTLLTLAAAGVYFTAHAEEIVQLPNYTVSAAVMAAMIPRDQVRDICAAAAPYRGSFDLSEVTFIKAPESIFAAPPRCYVRDANGRVRAEITNPDLRFPVEHAWADGYLSSNQPEQYAAFYLVLRPRFGPGGLTLGALDQLLADYRSFSERRLNEAIHHYGAEGSWCIDLRWQTVSDEVDIVAASPATAAAIGHRLQLEPQGRVLRLNGADLAELKAKLGAATVIAQPAEIDTVAPWRFTAGPPPVRDHAALIRVGWVEYRKGTQAPRHDFVTLLLDSAPPGA